MENIKENNNTKPKSNSVPPMYVFALGGLGEVGKNMYVVEQGNEIWIMDSGIKFAQEVTINGIIPSFEYLINNKHKIQGLIITHGHEDHIGAVPHLLDAVKIPKVYAGRIAAGLIRKKTAERRVAKPRIQIINNRTEIKSHNFKISFFNVNHSIPDSYGVVFKSKHGTVVNTGDFKFDLTPVGARADLNKMSRLGDEGVTLLLSDSTNSLVDKFSPSEADVRDSIDPIVKNAKGRVIAATFASNVYRVRELIKIALKHNRKVAIFGYSMDKVVQIARTIKYINLPDDAIINPRKIKNYEDNEIFILSTGTQGETNAALSKMATGRHKEVKINSNDTVIFASSAIPGNFESVEIVTNELIKKGAKVFDNKLNPGVHASGHGGRPEQLIMLSLIRPHYFMPVHGETVMQITHKETAISSGVDRNNTFILTNGDRLMIQNKTVTQTGSVPAGDVYVDETNLSGQTQKVISDRLTMSKNGVMVITVGIDSVKNEVIVDPIIDTKGTFDERSNKDFIAKISNKVKEGIQDYYKSSDKISFSGLKDIIKTTASAEVFKERKITPVIVPVIINKQVKE